MGLYLAVDAGGTNTTWLLADGIGELARVMGGSIKRMRVSADQAHANMAHSLRELERSSGIKMTSVDYACVGTAGETVPLVVDWIRSELSEELGHNHLKVVGDVEIALDAGFQGGRGVLVLAGTGSNVCGRTYDGRMVRAGGWGPAIADQGSGYWIGREGLRRAFFAMDNHRPTMLLEAIQAAWDVYTPEQVVAAAHAAPPPDFSKLSRVVTACAEMGDEVASAVLREAGEDLAELAMIAMRQVRQMEKDTYGDDMGPTGVAVAGSILKHVPAVKNSMVHAMHRVDPAIVVQSHAVDPVQGALWAARKMAKS